MKARKMVLSIIFSLLALVASQGLALIIAGVFLVIKIPEYICNILAGVMYITFAIYFIQMLCRKYIKEDIRDYYIPRFKLKLEWIIVAIALPILVSVCFLLLSGSFEKNAIDLNQKLTIVSAGIFFTGLGAGIVEEIVFRGIIMNVVEKRFDRKVAIIVPSLLFGILHIIGTDFNLLSCALVILAGTMAGIMFSLIALKTKSIWNSAIVHALWNIIIIGGFLSIGTSFNKDSLYSYVLDTKSFVWTGGEFGIESSIIGVAGYFLVCLVAILLDKKLYRKNQ